jgi:hypothetical protein
MGDPKDPGSIARNESSPGEPREHITDPEMRQHRARAVEKWRRRARDHKSPPAPSHKVKDGKLVPKPAGR